MVKFAVLTATYQRAKPLARLCKQLSDQASDEYQVNHIVMDDASGKSIMTQHAQIIKGLGEKQNYDLFITYQKERYGVERHYALIEALWGMAGDADYVIFLPDDVVICDDFFLLASGLMDFEAARANEISAVSLKNYGPRHFARVSRYLTNSFICKPGFYKAMRGKFPACALGGDSQRLYLAMSSKAIDAGCLAPVPFLSLVDDMDIPSVMFPSKPALPKVVNFLGTKKKED